MFEVDGVPPVAARVSGADQHDSWSSVVFSALGFTVTVALLLFGSLWLVYHYCVKMDEATRRLHDIIERMEAGEILINGEPVEQLEDPVDHPIWYIRTQGLQQWAVDSISVVKYKEAEGLVEGADCAICLSEFEEDESLRLLPKCAHAFHVPCIDQWFRSNKNCPLCRTLITHVNGRPVFSMEAVHEAIRRSQVEWESRSVLVRQQPVEMVTGYANTSESDSDSDSSENGSDGFIADKNSSYSGSRKVKAESDPAENQRVPDKELTQVHGTLADTNIAVDLDASPDPNSPPAQKMKANWSGGTLGKRNSSDNDQARTRGMAKKRAASYGSKPSSAKSGSSESRVESDGM